MILIRHGQYNLKGKTDPERYLSDLGREQAVLTGHYFSEHEIQGPPWQSGYFKLTRTGTQMEVRFCFEILRLDVFRHYNEFFMKKLLFYKQKVHVLDHSFLVEIVLV